MLLSEKLAQPKQWAHCLCYLLDARIEMWGAGPQRTVRQLLDHVEEEIGGPDADAALAETRAMLATLDLGLSAPGDLDDGWTLAVPYASQLLAPLFAKIPEWPHWTEMLASAPAAYLVADADAPHFRINGVSRRCTLIRLDQARPRASIIRFEGVASLQSSAVHFLRSDCAEPDADAASPYPPRRPSAALALAERRAARMSASASMALTDGLVSTPSSSSQAASAPAGGFSPQAQNFITKRSAAFWSASSAIASSCSSSLRSIAASLSSIARSFVRRASCAESRRAGKEG